jgi:hypothetical protein
MSSHDDYLKLTKEFNALMGVPFPTHEQQKRIREIGNIFDHWNEPTIGDMSRQEENKKKKPPYGFW